MSLAPAAALIEASPVGMLLTDDEGYISFANPAAQVIVNLSARALLDAPAAKLLGLPASFSRAVASGEALSLYDMSVAGTSVDVHLTPLGDAGGGRLVSLYASGSARPIAEGYDTGRSVVGVAAMLAHEIKNPLAGIRGAAQLLEGGSGDQARFTQLIQTEVDRITRLIDRMESFTDDRPLDRAAHNVHAIVDHALGLAEAARARGVAVERLFDPSLPPVLVEPDSMAQALLNLIINAVEASPEGGTVTVETRYRHGVSMLGADGRRRNLGVEVRVIDEGDGPPRELVDHLFQPFVSSKATGRGIGLALVDKLTIDNGGRIQFAREGTPPRTVFRLLLEVAP
ncbi:histidine kinase [Sphingomonas antarctica]|uniref:two-component system sensor histidine kinase NtrB n=1 Tax=Sphingomonas antarctica TaxID=2040274 RepID=UPI0039EC7234